MPTEVLLFTNVSMVHVSFQTPKNVGNVEVVENVCADVTEP